MTMFGSPWFGSAGAAFTIDQSCRFTTAATSYLTWTPGDAPDSQRKFTFSYWMKRGKIDTTQQIHTESTGATGGTAGFGLYITSSNKLELYSSPLSLLSTTATHTTTNDWVHVVEVIDTTQATDTNRLKLYVDGALVTSFVSTNYPAQNADMSITSSGVVNRIGATSGSNYPMDLYLAEFHYLDGIAAAVGDFGETVDGVWVPKEYGGSYGGHGYYMDFADSADLGADQSGNSNDFTSSGLASSDQMKDSPTNNFAVFDTLVANAPVANWKELNLETAGAGWSSTRWAAMSTLIIPTDKKIYFEVNSSVNHGSYYSFGGGTASSVPSSTLVGGTGSVTYLNAAAWVNGSEVGSYGTRIAAGEIGQCAIDGATGKVWFGKDNTWFSSGDPAAGSSEAGTITNGGAEDLHVVVAAYGTVMLNFGQDSSFDGDETRQNNADGDGFGDFYYAPPSGFLALCTKNGATL